MSDQSELIERLRHEGLIDSVFDEAADLLEQQSQQIAEWKEIAKEQDNALFSQLQQITELENRCSEYESMAQKAVDAAEFYAKLQIATHDEITAVGGDHWDMFKSACIHINNEFKRLSTEENPNEPR